MAKVALITGVTGQDGSYREYIQTPPNCLTLNSVTPNCYAFRSTIAA